MFEYYGWLSLVTAPYEDDSITMLELRPAVEQMVSDVRPSLGMIDFKILNATYIITLAGCTNRPGFEFTALMDFLKSIARLAPGSYGLVYVIDDESDLYPNEFQVYCVCRGAVTKHGDPFLSPRIPTIEDPDPLQADKEF